MMKPYAALTLLALTLPVFAQQPPTTSSGAIGNETLVANKDVANAQAVGIITKFMSEGTQTCDAEGKNCRGLFGGNDSFDFTTAQQQVQRTTGIQAFSFMEDGNTNSVAAQTSTLVLACADRAVKNLSGIAFKALGCQVNTEGDVELKYQVCTAPSRGNPVTQPDNAVWCSTDPAHPSYRPPAGKVCLRAACDTEPVNSLNGWSAPQTVIWDANLPASAPASQRTNNGLGLTFYPSLTGGVTPSFKAGSDNMTAVKVVESYLNPTTSQSAVALRVAFRHKATVTKEMITSGSGSVPDPGAHTAQWDTLLKLQDNPLIPQYQQKFAQNGSECIQQIQNGISKDGKITVCDPNFVGESGVRPIQKTAQVASQGQECSTTAQCLEQVVNTNTWTESCQADVPLAIRSCDTTQDYQMVDIHSTRRRSQDICREKRTTAQYTCSTSQQIERCTVPTNNCATGGILPDSASVSNGTYTFTFNGNDLALANEVTATNSVTSADFRFTILGKDRVTTFKINSIHSDNWVGLRVNGTFVGVHSRGVGGFNGSADRLAVVTQEVCYSWGDDNETCYPQKKVQYGPNSFQNLETGNNLLTSESIELKQYLREGVNVITMNVVNGGGPGYGRVGITAFQQCPHECTFKINNACAQYEAAK